MASSFYKHQAQLYFSFGFQPLNSSQNPDFSWTRTVLSNSDKVITSIIVQMFSNYRNIISGGALQRLTSLPRRNFSTQKSNFWQWTTTSRPSWKENSKEAAVAIVVFGVTGSLSMLAVRPSLKSVFGIEGTLVDGPNSYRVISLLCVSPIYATILLAIGTLSGRHNYFAKMSMKILGRFAPKSVINRIICNPAKLKQK